MGQAKVTIIIPIRHISESESLVPGGCHDCDGGQFHHEKYMCTAYIFLSGTFGLGIIIVTLACPLCISRLLLSCVLLGTVLYVITLTCLTWLGNNGNLGFYQQVTQQHVFHFWKICWSYKRNIFFNKNTCPNNRGLMTWFFMLKTWQASSEFK